MGNWRNRSLRRIYRQKWPPRSPPMPSDPEPHHSHSGFGEDGIPLWEKRFCSLIGSVPWRKIVDAKKFMYCHSNVLDWEDTAGEEAFQSAKKRFWAEMNGLYCDIRLPDPDTYIDEIDWNPVIDPELIKELDREYFAPDDGEENRKAGRKNKKSRNCVPIPSDNLDNGVNPWDCNIIPGTGTWESKPTGLNQWNNNINGSKNLENKDNPWECNVAQGSGNKEDNAWGDCKNNSRGMGWNQTQSHVSQPRNWNDDDDNRWDHGCQGFASVKNSGWSNSWDKSWGMNKQESKNMESFDNPWKPSVGHRDSRAPEDSGRRDYGGGSSCRKQLDHYNDQKKAFEFRRARGGRGDWNEDNSQKREDSYHDINGHRNSRFQGDANQTGGHHWRGNNKKRSFYPLSSR